MGKSAVPAPYANKNVLFSGLKGQCHVFSLSIPYKVIYCWANKLTFFTVHKVGTWYLTIVLEDKQAPPFQKIGRENKKRLTSSCADFWRSAARGYK